MVQPPSPARPLISRSSADRRSTSRQVGTAEFQRADLAVLEADPGELGADQIELVDHAALQQHVLPGARPRVQERDLGVGDDQPVEASLVRHDGSQPGTRHGAVAPQAAGSGEVGRLHLGEVGLDQVRPRQVHVGEVGAGEGALGEGRVAQVPTGQIDLVVELGRVAVAVQQRSAVGRGLSGALPGRDLRRSGTGGGRHVDESRRTVTVSSSIEGASREQA